MRSHLNKGLFNEDIWKAQVECPKLSIGEWGSLSITAEVVGKVQMANPDTFGTVKNQQLTDYRKPKNAQI